MAYGWRDRDELIRESIGFEPVTHLREWARSVPIYYEYAANEKYPYTEEETGQQMRKMQRKDATGFDQTGDYHCFLPYYMNKKTLKPLQTGVFWERKEKSDLYNTLIYDMDRFKNECQRAIDDPRCSYMVIGAECTIDKFLNYIPAGQRGASLASRYALANSIGPRYDYKVFIMWCGDRAGAVKKMEWANRQWLRYHYKEVFFDCNLLNEPFGML